MKKFQRKIKLNGKIYNSVSEACKKLKFSYSLALSRLAKGESVKNAFFKGKLLHKGIEVVVNNKKYRSLEDARLQLNPKASKRSVNWRYRNGWPIKAALELVNYQRKDREQIKFRGKTYESLSSLARAYGASVDLFIRRMKSPEYKRDFTISEALGLKKFNAKGYTKKIVIAGKKYPSIAAAARNFNIGHNSIRDRIKKGWSIEQAFELKKRKDHHPGKIGIIYLVKNKINGMNYIGASLGSLSKRWKDHVEAKTLRKGSLQEAIHKFGKRNFSKKIIKRCKYLSELSKFERFYIKKYNSIKPNGYNLSSGGFGMGNLGKKMTIQNKKFNSLRDAAKYYNIKPNLFVGRLHGGWSVNEALGLKERRKINLNYIKVKIDGKKFDNVRADAKFYGIHEHTARTRIGRGWSIEKALKTKKVDLAKKIKFNGKTFGSIRKLAKYYKVSSGTLAGKLSRGIPIKKALNL